MQPLEDIENKGMDSLLKVTGGRGSANTLVLDQ
jgi:hypothetical protein